MGLSQLLHNYIIAIIQVHHSDLSELQLFSVVAIVSLLSFYKFNSQHENAKTLRCQTLLKASQNMRKAMSANQKPEKGFACSCILTKPAMLVMEFVAAFE